jgi:hypothetical protein
MPIDTKSAITVGDEFRFLHAREPPFGAVIVIWPELPSAMQSGVFCARAGGRGAGEGPVYVFGTSGSDGAGRAFRSPPRLSPDWLNLVRVDE